MGLFEQFPYTNFHDLNLDWIIEQIKTTKSAVENLTSALNSLTANIDNNIDNAVSTKLENMLTSGELADITASLVTPTVTGMARGAFDLSKILVIGDSFVGNWQLPDITSWPYILRDKLGLNADDMTIYSFGGGGYIALDIDHKQNYIDNFNNVIIPELGDSIKDYTTVIVFSGPNDYDQTFDNEYGHVLAFLNRVKAVMPNAKILGVNGATLAKKYLSTQYGTNAGYSAAGCASLLNAPYWLVGRTEMFTDDALHPNQAGHNYIANRIYANLMTGCDSADDNFGFISNSSGTGGTIWTRRNNVINVLAYGTITDIKSSGTYDIANLPSYFAPSTVSYYSVATGWGIGAEAAVDMNGRLFLQMESDKLEQAPGLFFISIDLPLLIL